MQRAMIAATLLGLSLSVVAPQVADAQPSEPTSPHEVGVAVQEEPDSTRLDVERLPPEAAPLRRELFARGAFVDARLGARGFVGDLGKVARPGPLLRIDAGYEVTRWFAFGLGLSGSIHPTDHPPPPTETAFEALEALAHVRFSVPIRVQAALWLRAEGGLFAPTGDILRALDFHHGDDVVGNVGGTLGFDWHVKGRHHSFGVEAGSHWLPGLARGTFSLSIHGALYLHYVF